ncbi:hypothetical protein SDC9_49941 [bioreactor metagenome]|uniref:Uncharacterized protein n=1 Tax=bioreactor metagenome TaxID=1076179 RepID=A0A644WN65_9ZZZZ
MTSVIGGIDGDTLGVEKQCKALIAKTVLGHSMQNKEHSLDLPLLRHPYTILYSLAVAAIQPPDCSHRPLPVLFIFI